MASSPRSILVVSLRYFGDVLLTTPLIRSLRRAFDAAAIDVLLIAGTEGILEGNPDVSAILTIAERPTPGAHLALLRRLWRRYDLAVVAETGDRPHLYGLVAARQRSGLLPPEFGKRWWKRPLLHRAVESPARQPRVDAYRRLAEAMAVPFVPEVVAPAAGSAAPAWIARLGFDHGREAYAVLHLAPRFRYKRWHAEGWRSLISALGARGLRIVITGGGGTEERVYVAQVLGGCNTPVVDLSGALRFAETADLLRGAALYVGPDTATIASRGGVRHARGRAVRSDGPAGVGPAPARRARAAVREGRAMPAPCQRDAPAGGLAALRSVPAGGMRPPSGEPQRVPRPDERRARDRRRARRDRGVAYRTDGRPSVTFGARQPGCVIRFCAALRP